MAAPIKSAIFIKRKTLSSSMEAIGEVMIQEELKDLNALLVKDVFLMQLSQRHLGRRKEESTNL